MRGPCELTVNSWGSNEVGELERGPMLHIPGGSRFPQGYHFFWATSKSSKKSKKSIFLAPRGPEKRPFSLVKWAQNGPKTPKKGVFWGQKKKVLGSVAKLIGASWPRPRGYDGYMTPL